MKAHKRNLFQFNLNDSEHADERSLLHKSRRDRRSIFYLLDHDRPHVFFEVDIILRNIGHICYAMCYRRIINKDDDIVGHSTHVGCF